LEESFGFQNCIIRLKPLLFFDFSFMSEDSGACSSIDNLLFSPWELWSSRDKLAMLERFRVTDGPDIDTERW